MPLIPLTTLLLSGVSAWFTDQRNEKSRQRLELVLGMKHGVSKIDGPRAVRTPDECCGPGRDKLCVYHATRPTALPSIALYGLEPMEPSPELEQPTGVYFSPLPTLAAGWNDVLLRFPWPDDSEEDPRSEAITIGRGRKEWTRSGFYSERTVPPELIEVWTKDGWVSLMNPEFELSICFDNWMASEIIEAHYGELNPFGLGEGCLTFASLCWTGHEILPQLDVDVLDTSLAQMFAQLRHRDIDFELIGPWRTEHQVSRWWARGSRRRRCRRS